MKNVQLLFSGAMADANVKGWKDETRRTRGLDGLNVYPNLWNKKDISINDRILTVEFIDVYQSTKRFIKCPYGVPGDVLCQRETLVYADDMWRYAADRSGFAPGIMPYDWKPAKKVVPNMHMPHWACRFKRTIKEITIERVQDITADGAFAEGIRCEVLPEDDSDTARAKYVPAYRDLWVKLNGAESWEKNVWVWVVKY